MSRHHRQGWRLQSLLTRLSVASVLSLQGLTPLVEPITASAESPVSSPPATNKTADGDGSKQSPSPALRRPPDLLPADSLPTSATVKPARSNSPFTLILPTPPSLKRLTERRLSLNQLLIRDRRHHLLLSRGEEALSQGEAAEAVSHFQTLVDAPQDAFVWPARSADPIGAQLTVNRRLLTFPVRDREAYERLHGDEARALLAEAVDSGRVGGVLNVLRRFPCTAAGRDALVRDLLRSLDSGRRHRATDIAHRLQADAFHHRELSDGVRSLVEQLTSADQGNQLSEEIELADVSPPAPWARWTLDFVDTVPSADITDSDSERELSARDLIGTAIDEWRDERLERRLPVATSNAAIVVGNVVCVRSFADIRTCDLETGRTLWTYRCAGSIAAVALDDVKDIARSGGARPLSYQRQAAANGPRGRLTSDGLRLFVIDDAPNSPDILTTTRSTTTNSSNVGASTIGERGSRRIANQLIALPITVIRESSSPRLVSEPSPLWSRSTLERPGSESLEGHVFLGPPLAVDGQLFAMTERDGELYCLALSAADGRLLWRQPIALLEQSLVDDRRRQQTACVPLYANGTVICPTEIGVVVGVDALTGMLVWAYDHLDGDQRRCAGRWCSQSQRDLGMPELPSRTIARAGRILHLPSRSRYLHCVDATTGSSIWKAPRDGALSLSAVTHDAVILLGPRECIARSTVDGALLWETDCAEPTGHGIVTGAHYLWPTIDGHCLSIRLADGVLEGSRFGRLIQEVIEKPTSMTPDSATPNETTPESVAPSGSIQLVSHTLPASQGSASPSTSRRLDGSKFDGGNLCLAGDAIVFTTPTGVAVRQQSAPLLRSLTTSVSIVDDKNVAVDEEDRLRMAMLMLSLDQREAARSELRHLAASDADRAVHSAAVYLLREVLFVELTDAIEPLPILDELKALAERDGTTTDRMRLLLSRIETSIRLRDADRLTAAISALLDMPDVGIMHVDGDRDYRVHADAYVSDLLASVRDSDSEVVAAVEDMLTRAVNRTSPSAPLDESLRIMTLFDDWPQVDVLRTAVAAQLWTTGSVQRAELILLEVCATPHSPAAVEGRRLLLGLYDEYGLHREAARLLDELDSEFANVRCSDGLCGREIVGRFPHDHPAMHIFRRRQSQPLPAYDVRVSEHLCDESCGDALTCEAALAREQHDRIRRKYVSADDVSLTLIDRGIVGDDRRHSQLALVNQETGESHGLIEVPIAYWQIASRPDGGCGQLLPVCSSSAHGLSLLECRPLWSTPHAEDRHAREKIRIGPVGTDYCVLQTPRTLFVVDPATGDIRWQRENLAPNVGLMANETSGMIGDGEHLILFGDDGLDYTVFRMCSGRRLRTSRIPSTHGGKRRYRRGVGTSIVSVVSNDEGDRLCVWDAAVDKMRVNQPLHGRLFCPLDDGVRYALIHADGRLLVVDVKTGETSIEVALSPEDLEGVDDLVVSEDADRLLVNLVDCSSKSTEGVSAATDEVELPNVRVKGRLLSISQRGHDRQHHNGPDRSKPDRGRQGHIEWKRSVDDAVLLTNNNERLPIITLITRVRNPDHRQNATLCVEVLDGRTGETLCCEEGLLRTRLVRSRYDHRRGRLSLIGLDSTIDINFGRPQQPTLIHAEVDNAARLIR